MWESAEERSFAPPMTGAALLRGALRDRSAAGRRKAVLLRLHRSIVKLSEIKVVLP